MENLENVTLIQYDELEALIQKHIKADYEIDDDFPSVECYSCWLVKVPTKKESAGHFYGSNLIRLVQKGVLPVGTYLVWFSW